MESPQPGPRRLDGSLDALALGPSLSDSITKGWPEIDRLSHIFAVTPFTCGSRAFYIRCVVLEVHFLPFLLQVDCENIRIDELLSSSYKTENKLDYPVNVARNIARETANTYFVFPSDIELYPNPGKC